MNAPARILCIAGSDSSGGAGIQADIKTTTMLGGYAMTAITAVTAQNTRGVEQVSVMTPDMVLAQVDAVFGDIGVDAVKIGMIGSADIANGVADYLRRSDVPVVFDPVMVATSGSDLADKETITAFDRLMAISTVVTPNIPELEALGGKEAVLSHDCHLLLKDGHGTGKQIVDRLYSPEGLVKSLEGKRFDTDDTHGTGCTLASAFACGLGQGMALSDAFDRAVCFVRRAILEAPHFGEGCGPMGHSQVRDFWDDDELAPGISLNQVTLAANDYAASVNFYKKLGLRQIVDSPDNGYARFEAGNGATFSIHAAAGDAGRGVTYFESPRLDDWAQELADAGIEFDQPPRDESWGWREARLRDPHGNIICLYHAGDNRRYPPWRIT